ncbi:hypothetical protein SAMN06269301_2849 [Geobacter sp. DSM 9736]|nr:hypothetical protein SAMN06269301_2849 [Geobacter sp. DSM 9736]
MREKIPDLPPLSKQIKDRFLMYESSLPGRRRQGKLRELEKKGTVKELDAESPASRHDGRTNLFWELELRFEQLDELDNQPVGEPPERRLTGLRQADGRAWQAFTLKRYGNAAMAGRIEKIGQSDPECIRYLVSRIKFCDFFEQINVAAHPDRQRRPGYFPQKTQVSRWSEIESKLLDSFPFGCSSTVRVGWLHLSTRQAYIPGPGISGAECPLYEQDFRTPLRATQDESNRGTHPIIYRKNRRGMGCQPGFYLINAQHVREGLSSSKYLCQSSPCTADMTVS